LFGAGPIGGFPRDDVQVVTEAHERLKIARGEWRIKNKE
jgi:hypothetical protein